jgi:hypothetical protein
MERSVNSSRLTRHFAAAAAAAVVGASASASVVYTAVNWVIPNNIDGLYINVETLATGVAGSGVAGWDLNPYSGATLTNLSWFNATGTGMLRFPGATTGSAGNLPVGTVVGSTGSYGSGAVTVGTAAGNWQLNASNYFGFRFTASDGLTHYGWGRFVIGSSITGADRYIAEIAWENVAGAQIAVGDQGGPPPAYDPCATFNPTLNNGTNNVAMNLDTAANLSSSCGTIYKANYFKFTPTADGTYTINTCSSGYDTTMAVLTACSGGSSLGCDNNGCGTSSTMTLTLTAGNPVYVVVGGSTSSATLPTTMSVDVVPPPIPACVQAVDLAYGDNVFDSSTNNGPQTVQSSANGVSTATINQSNWFKFVPSATGAFSFQTCGAAGTYTDTLLAIGTVCPGVGSRFSTLAFSDDAPCPAGSTTTSNKSFIDATNNGATGTYAGFPLTQNLVAGQTYYICVGSFSATSVVSGSLFVDGPQGTACPADLNHNGVVDGADLGLLLGNWGNSGIGDINGDGIVNGADLGTLLGAFGPCL